MLPYIYYFILTVEPGLTIAVFRNHGNESPRSISNILLPTQFETAISPIPKRSAENIGKMLDRIICKIIR